MKSHVLAHLGVKQSFRFSSPAGLVGPARLFGLLSPVSAPSVALLPFAFLKDPHFRQLLTSSPSPAQSSDPWKTKDRVSRPFWKPQRVLMVVEQRAPILLAAATPLVLVLALPDPEPPRIFQKIRNGLCLLHRA